MLIDFHSIIRHRWIWELVVYTIVYGHITYSTCDVEHTSLWIIRLDSIREWMMNKQFSLRRIRRITIRVLASGSPAAFTIGRALYYALVYLVCTWLMWVIPQPPQVSVITWNFTNLNWELASRVECYSAGANNFPRVLVVVARRCTPTNSRNFGELHCRREKRLKNLALLSLLAFLTHGHLAKQKRRKKNVRNCRQTR